MATYDYDLFTIGAGSGGVAASRRAGALGAKVGICEEARVGGTCVLRGCVPKKLLVYAAEFADAFSDAAGFGWNVGTTTHDWPTLIRHKDRELDRLNGIYLRLLKEAGVALHQGLGRFVDEHTVEVAGEKITAAHILIATGGHPEAPVLPGIEHAISSNEALELPSLPEHIVIVGGGYIGLEFAGIFHTLGARVTLVIRGDLPLRGFDEDVRLALSEELRARGIDIRTGAEVTGIVPHGEDAHQGGFFHPHAHRRRYGVSLGDGQFLEADAVLFATGRLPNTKRLNLDAAGVDCNRIGAVSVDDDGRTSVPHIYAVGDVTDRLNLTPVAIAQGRALVETLFGGNPSRANLENVPSAVFSQPPVAVCGLTEAEARRRHGEIDVYTSRFRPMKNTLSGRDERTFMKMIVDRRSDRVLGCHMVGRDAAEIMQGLAIAMHCGATKRQFDHTIGIHPSAAEEFVTMRVKRPEIEAKAAE